jgi:hypothetical protein
MIQFRNEDIFVVDFWWFWDISDIPLIDMNPLGFVPDLSMRGVGITRLKETTFTAQLQPVQGCALATDTPPPMAAAILWSASPGH